MGLHSFEILIITASGISFIMGLYMILLYQGTSKTNGTGYWAFGSLIIGMGLLFKLLSPADGFFPLVLPSLFISAGLYSYLAGIWQFKNKKIKNWVVFGIPTLNLIQSLIFFYLFPLHKVRMVLHTFFLVIYCMIAIYEMLSLTTEKKYLQKIFRLNAISFFAYLGLLLVSALGIIRTPIYNPNELSDLTIGIYMISGFIMITLTFGFISAVNLQLFWKLEGQLKTKTKIFTIIAHDLKGPIGLIMGFLNLMDDKSPWKQEKKQNYLETLQNLSRSTFHLLQNLLEWSASSIDLTEVKSELVDLNQLISSNINFFNQLSIHKSIQVEYKEGIQTLIYGDQKMLETVIRNLVSNAIKFTPNGGKVSLTTQKNATKIQLKVKDTGQGIDPKNLKAIFNFEQSESTKGTEGETGSGLGLVLCKEFIERNKGTIKIESTQNIGTTVIVEFPAINKE